VSGAVIDIETAQRVLGVPGEFATFSPDGRLLAFYGWRGGMWVMPAAGGKRRYLGRAVGETEEHAASPPTWSRDSRHVAYEAGGDIVVHDLRAAKGRPLLRTARLETEPRWSPDGRWIAFVRGPPADGRDTRTGVSVVRPDGTGLRVLTDLELTESSPSWSPDSRQLAFLADRDSEDGAQRAYVMSVTGGRLRRIIPPLCGRPEHLAALSWGPGGRFLFASSREDDFQLYAARSDGSDTRRIPGSCVDESAPAWSPDGRQLAYERDGLVHAMRADGAGDRRLATGNEPDWSPDGKTIVFSRPKDQLYVVSAGGGDARRLTSLGQSSSPAWSGTAGRIAFTSTRDGRAEVYTMLPDGSAQRRVTQLGGSDPSWSPDGRRITYVREHALWTIGSDGSDPHLLLTTPSEFDTIDDPEWSPDGSTIAFAAYDDYWTLGSLAFIPANGAGRMEWMPYSPFIGSTHAGGYASPDWYPR